MSGRKMTLVFSLVVSLDLLVPGDVTYASEPEHNHCRQHRFGEFSDWSEPVNLGPSINTEFNEMHLAISADELSVFLATDRPGGFGGLDLWVAQRPNRHADWGPAQNLGPNFNTSLVDFCPYLSSDGHWLFFCSNGFGGFGGEDLFASFREDTGDNLGWQEPFNLGEGVNSELDDGDPNVYVEPETGAVTMYPSWSRNSIARSLMRIPPSGVMGWKYS